MNSTGLLQVVPTTCYRAASQQLVNKLWVTNLLQAWWTQQPCYKLFQQLVIVLQVNNLSTSCEQQTCYKLDELNSLVTSCSNNLLSCCKSTTCQQVVSNKLATSLMNSTALLQVVPTTCYRAASQQVVNKLWVTNLLQAWWTQQPCYKLFQQLVIGLQVNNLSTSCE